MNAEQLFLVHLQKLHHAFPKLRIVLEHATTAAAVRMVQSLGPTVACTITVHHLALIGRFRMICRAQLIGSWLFHLMALPSSMMQWTIGLASHIISASR